MGFNFPLYFIQVELRQMSKYLDVVSSALSENANNVKVAFEEAMKNDPVEQLPDDDIDWVVDDYQEDLIEAEYEFPRLLLVSFVILWYSFVEQKLLDFCEELNLTITVSPKNRESMGKGVRRARRFLSIVKNYEIDQTQWNELVYISKLRNLLVHEGKEINLSYLKPEGDGILYQKDGDLDIYLPVEKDLFNYMKRHDLFIVSGLSFEITPSVDYCKGLVKLATEIFNKLYKDLKTSKSK